MTPEQQYGVVIPHYKNREALLKTLKSLFAMESHFPRENLLIALDGVGREYGEKLLEELEIYRGIRILFLENNGGFAKTVNAGIKELLQANDAITRILILNDDCELSTPFISPAESQFQRDKKIGIQGAFLIFPNNRIQHAGVIALGFGEHFYSSFKIRKASFWAASISRYTDIVTGAYLIVTREAFGRLKGFDENFPFAYEDCKFCLQAWGEGIRVWYNADLRGIHFEGGTRGKKIEEKIKGDLKLFLAEARSKLLVVNEGWGFRLKEIHRIIHRLNYKKIPALFAQVYIHLAVCEKFLKYFFLGHFNIPFENYIAIRRSKRLKWVIERLTAFGLRSLKRLRDYFKTPQFRGILCFPYAKDLKLWRLLPNPPPPGRKQKEGIGFSNRLILYQPLEQWSSMIQRGVSRLLENEIWHFYHEGAEDTAGFDSIQRLEKWAKEQEFLFQLNTWPLRASPRKAFSLIIGRSFSKWLEERGERNASIHFWFSGEEKWLGCLRPVIQRLKNHPGIDPEGEKKIVLNLDGFLFSPPKEHLFDFYSRLFDLKIQDPSAEIKPSFKKNNGGPFVLEIDVEQFLKPLPSLFFDILEILAQNRKAVLIGSRRGENFISPGKLDPDSYLDLQGAIPREEKMEWVKNAGGFVGALSPLTHVALDAGIPTLLLSGPRNEALWFSPSLLSSGLLKIIDFKNLECLHCADHLGRLHANQYTCPLWDNFCFRKWPSSILKEIPLFFGASQRSQMPDTRCQFPL